MTRKRKLQFTRAQPPRSSAESAQNNNNQAWNGKFHNSNGVISKNRQMSSPALRKTEKQCGDFEIKSVDCIFPTWTPWVVFLLTLFGRVVYVSQVNNWWILHPDEVFQSVEVAFSELYGYGFRAYEFLPPPGEQLGSHARQQEANLGMHSLRSFLYPRVFVLVMLVGDWFGIKPFLMAKVFHAAVASLLPLATYFFSLTLFHCHDIASLASVLVGFSVHLTVFGTHTLLNSFVAPIVLFSLVPVMKNILSAGRKLYFDDDQSKESAVDAYYSNRNVLSEIPTKMQNGQPQEIIENTNGTNTGNSGEWNRAITLFFAGMTLGILCYVRIDLMLFLVCLVAPHCLKTRCNQLLLTLDLQVLLPIILGFASGMFLGGLEDKWSYGVWFLSPYQWLRFNVGFDFTTVLFGKQELGYYFNKIIFHNCSLICISAVFAGVFIFAAISSDFRKEHGQNLAMLLRLLIPVTMLFIIYSLKGHKEMRFVHNALVLLLVMYSSAIILPLKYLISRGWTRTRVKASTYVCISLYVFNQWFVMPTPVDQSNKAWVYNSGWDSHHVNGCFDYISEQSDVTGVFVDRSIHTSAAFSVLRQDVPLLGLIHYELYEFGPDSYLHLIPVTSSARKASIHVRTLSSISNYISIYNSHDYLFKYLLSRKQYNYLVMKKEKLFMDKGYELVYTSGTMKVLRRTYDKSAEEYLAKVAAALPFGSNATILEYEASWLLTFGLLNLAEQRLLTAVQLGNPTARLFQILVKVFLDQNKLDHARKAEQWCIDRHGVDVCRTPQPRIILHKDYDIDLPR